MHTKVKNLCYIALFAALIAVCTWITVPGAVPFTMQTFAVMAAVGLLGMQRGLASVALHQQRQRLAARLQRPGNHLGAFGNEHALFRLQPVAQLGLGQAGVYLQPWLIQAGDLNNLCHAGLLSAAGTIFRRGMVSPAIVAVWGGGVKLAHSAIAPPL